MRKTPKRWTEDDTDILLECRNRNWPDERIAHEIGVTRMTVWRRRNALGIRRADHPKKRDRLTERIVRVETIRLARAAKREMQGARP